MDCFAEPVIGRRFAPTRWLAMTGLMTSAGCQIRERRRRVDHIAADHRQQRSDFPDLAVLSSDYLTAPVNEIGKIRSVLTMLGGKVVYASGPFERLASDGAR